MGKTNDGRNREIPEILEYTIFSIKRRSLEEIITSLAGQHSEPLNLRFRIYSASWSKRVEQEPRDRVSAERSLFATLLDF